MKFHALARFSSYSTTNWIEPEHKISCLSTKFVLEHENVVIEHEKFVTEHNNFVIKQKNKLSTLLVHHTALTYEVIKTDIFLEKTQEINDCKRKLLIH